MKTICSYCNKLKDNVFNRNLLKNDSILLCEQCYKNSLDTCSLCKRKKKTYTHTSNSKPICKKCYLEAPRKCSKCNNLLPAGRGRICYECSCKNRLAKKLLSLNIFLSNYTNVLFEEFAWWLSNRKGVEYAANFIQKYFTLFYKIDFISNKLNKFPQYTELLDNFKVATTRKYLLIMIFLNEINLIKINDNEKQLYSNLNIIESYLNYFDKDSDDYKIINKYYSHLFEKYILKKTTIHSIRLALTPAIKLLNYKKHFNVEKLNNEIVNGYLWIYLGQKASLTGFINFLNINYKSDLNSIKNINHSLNKSSTNKKRLKLRLITLLNKATLNNDEKTRLIYISIEYFHRIKIPKNVYLDINNIFKFEKEYYICCCKNKFYINRLLYDKIKNPQ